MKVAIVQGGPSAEAAVSRASAKGVEHALNDAGHETVLFELDRELPGALLRASPDVVFPVVHGNQGEDGCLQGLLEVLGLAYVGSDVQASAIAADKLASKLFFRAAGLTCAKDRALAGQTFSTEVGEQQAVALLEELRADLGPSFIVKPAKGGSTIGMSRILSHQGSSDLTAALSLAFAQGDHVLVEEYVEGQEVTCPVLDTRERKLALPPVGVTPQATEWYDFESKYKKGGSTHRCPAPLEQAMLEKLERAAWDAHRAVGARDLSRSDFLLTTDGRVVLLEVNTLPGMTEMSIYPESAAVAGISFPELVDLFVENAKTRGASRHYKAPPMPTG